MAQKNTESPEGEKVELVFSQARAPDEFRRLGLPEAAAPFRLSVDRLLSMFRDFRVDSIELWIETGAKSGKLTELIIAAEGKAGCKVTLKPKA